MKRPYYIKNTPLPPQRGFPPQRPHTWVRTMTRLWPLNRSNHLQVPGAVLSISRVVQASLCSDSTE